LKSDWTEGEKQNLAFEDPARVKALGDRLAAWRKTTGALLPTPNVPTEAPRAPS
jgi:hypothetical protein